MITFKMNSGFIFSADYSNERAIHTRIFSMQVSIHKMSETNTEILFVSRCFCDLSDLQRIGVLKRDGREFSGRWIILIKFSMILQKDI